VGNPNKEVAEDEVIEAKPLALFDEENADRDRDFPELLVGKPTPDDGAWYGVAKRGTV
jgi:hypothetical protein